jgi:hypothetical protein
MSRAVTTAAPAKAAPIRVRATKYGFYGDYAREVGKVFTLTDPKHFSAKWMEKVDPSTPDDYAHVVPRKKPGVIEGRHFHKTYDPTAPAPAMTPTPATKPAKPASSDDDGTDI